MEYDVPVYYIQGAEGDIAPLLSASCFSIKNEPIQAGKTNIAFKERKKGFIAARFYGEWLSSIIFPYIQSIPCENVNEIESHFTNLRVPIKSYPINNRFPEILKYIQDALVKGLLLRLFRFLNPIIIGFQNFKKNFNHTYAHVVRIGHLILILSPGEMFYEYGEKLMHFSKTSYEHSCIIGLANDYASYLYPVKEYAKRGYENSFQIAPLNGPKIVGALKHLLKTFFKEY
jgi:hypothetical protein